MQKAISVILFIFFAAYTPPGPMKYTEYIEMPATALTSPVSTSWLNVGGYNQLTFELVFVDADSSITRLDWSCITARSDATPSGSDPTYNMKTISVAGGIITMQNAAFQYAVSGSENLSQNLRVNYRWLKCTFSAGTGSVGAGDTLSINARAGIGG